MTENSDKSETGSPAATAKEPVPVITIDGPSGSGKGTVSRLVALRLGWHFLDSGALYRLVGLAARNKAVSFDNINKISKIANDLDVVFKSDSDGAGVQIYLQGVDVSDAIRSEQAASDASIVASIPEVRRALLNRQRAFLQSPGLVADGRDMGSVVFPDAQLKVFLTASQQERANRRYKQLKDKGMDVNLPSLLGEIEVRDRRDSERQASPMVAAKDAVILDTTDISIDDVVNRVLGMWQQVEVTSGTDLN